MIAAVPKETFPGENRVAVVPASVAALKKLGIEVRVEAGAGSAAGFPDAQYVERGATIVADRPALLSAADLILPVRTQAGNSSAGATGLPGLRPGQILIGLADALSAGEELKELAGKNLTLLAMDLMPRTTRAQSMDVLSSQANLAGYKAVLLAAAQIGKMLPMMMTAAGTIQPARVFVIGAGVAGLQAIATAKRLGAVVHGFDVRPAVKEQVQSLGAKFVELPLDTASAEDKGGYARAQSDDQLARQRELMAAVVAESDIVVTTALIPGKPAPTLVTREMVTGMKPGSVIVDLAAERGGNCEVTQPGQTIEHAGVTIIGHDNLPSLIAHDASQVYSNNVVNLLKYLVKDDVLTLDIADEIVAGILVAREGEIVHPRVREASGLAPLPTMQPVPVT